VVGRYGGDEFAILLPGAPLDVARDVARRLQAAVARLRVPVRSSPEATMAVTVSAGVATAPGHADTAESLVAAADRALFGARRHGVGGVATADEVEVRPTTPRMDLDRFVGRVDEVRKLVGWLESACRGEGRLVTVVGEAGIGKSTLVRQLEPEVRVRAGVMAVGRGAAPVVKTPFGAWADILSAIHEQGIVPPRAWRALPRVVPALGDGSPVDDSVQGSPFVLLEEMVDYFRAAASVRPLVLVLEDMQWADRATWDALEFLVAQLDDARILICATIRAEEARDVADRRRRLARSRGFAQISLRRLTREELKRWLETVFHQGDIGADLPTFLHWYTEGNPLLVAQVLRALVDDGGVWYAGTRWEWRAPEQMQLPPACAQLVGRRIERLSPRAAAIIACAAMLGRSFDEDMLVAAGAGEPGDVVGALDEGVTAAVLIRSERRDAREYEFAHATLSDAARLAIPDRDQPAMHRRIARALELRTPTAVADIALHYHAAGDDREAYRYAMLAADRAASVHAHDEAAACLAVAQRHAPSADDLAAARIHHAMVVESAGRFEQAEELCDLALDHLSTTGDSARMLPVRRIRERLRARRGQPARRTLDACSTLLAEAESMHADEEAVALHVMIAHAHASLGDADAAERSARRAIRLSAARGDRRGHADALLTLGASLPGTRLEETLDRYREALALFIRLNDKHGLTRCWLATGDAHANAGRLGAAREALEVALDSARQAHAPDLAAVATFALATLDYKAGAFARSREHLDEALRLFTTVRDEANRTGVLLVLGHVAREDRRLADAITAYESAAARAQELDDDATRIAATAGAGLAAFDLGDAETAESCCRAAEEVVAAGASTTWVSGRELVDALAIRIMAAAGHAGLAAARFDEALAAAEPNDSFATVRLVAECAPVLLGAGVRTVIPTVERARYSAMASGFDRMAARLEL
jgi:predicted ATPase